METTNINILNSFGTGNIPDLDVAVMGALELFAQKSLPKIELDTYKHPLVVGSGNAEATGRIIFRKVNAIFASESDVKQKLEYFSEIDGVVLLSASGEKHAPVIAKLAKEMGKKVTLLTNSTNSSAEARLKQSEGDKIYILPKNREPYTYNTSTYMGMILATTGEDPEEIYRFIQEKVAKIDFTRFKNFDKYYLIVPNQFLGIIRMLEVKFIELFGRNIARDIETTEYVAHATTVAPAREMFVSFGEPNTTWGEMENRLTIPLPLGADYGAVMAVGYYVVAQIQKQQPAYFKDNIVDYMKQVSKIFGQEMQAIVE